MKAFISEIATVILIAITLQGLNYFYPVADTSGLSVYQTEPFYEVRIKTQVEFPIDLNFATKDELMALNGIGEKTADKIIAYRTEHNYFKTTQQLMQINGIGTSKFKQILPDICVDLDALGLELTK